MAGSLNKAMIIGNIGKDPDITTFDNGNRVCNFTVATTESWKDKATGEKRERTEWHRISVFNEGLIKICEKYLKKGSKVYVEGQIQTRKYTDQQGVDRYSTEIVLQGFSGTMTLLGGNPNDSGENSGNQ